MRLRTQLILAFLLLAVVPLAGVVGYSYWTNVGAMRSLLETEASELTERLEDNMTVASADLRQGLSGLDQRLAQPEMLFELQSVEVAIEEAMAAMGPVAAAIQGWRFDNSGDLIEEFESAPPEPAFAPQPPPPGDRRSPRPRPDGPPKQLNQQDAAVHELHRRRAEAMARMGSTVFKVEHDGTGSVREAPQDGAVDTRLERSRSPFRVRSGPEREGGWPIWVAPEDVAEDAVVGIPRIPTGADRVAAEERLAGLSEQLEEKELELEQLVKTGDLRGLARAGMETAGLALRRGNLERILGAGGVPEDSGFVALVPDLDVAQFVGDVLRGIEPNKEEVPFAVDGDDNLYTVTTEHHDQLLALFDDASELTTTSEEPVLLRREGWLLAHQLDTASGFTFGIARPYDASFAEIRARTGRNLLLGFGMIGFSLVGILPLSSRLTKRISSLSSEAERLAAGDLDARVPVRGRDELGHLSETFNRMASRLKSNQEEMLQHQRDKQREEVARTLLESENQRRGLELEEARKFQLAMLPAALPELDEFELAVFHRTATEVGGDYYDFGQREQALTIALGDATGHGARAATLVTVIRTLFLTAGASSGLAGFLNAAAGPLRSFSFERMAMSLLLVRLHRKEHRLTFASAGMPPAYRLRPSGEVEELECHAVPLGAMANVTYCEFEHPFEPGDTLVMLSDGLPEQPDSDGDPIGYNRLSEVLSEVFGLSPAAIVERLRKELEMGTGGGAPSDDVTLVAVRRRADRVNPAA